MRYLKNNFFLINYQSRKSRDLILNKFPAIVYILPPHLLDIDGVALFLLLGLEYGHQVVLVVLEEVLFKYIYNI